MSTNENDLLEEIQSCIDCMKCLEVCDTYIVTSEETKRIKAYRVTVETTMHFA